MEMKKIILIIIIFIITIISFNKVFAVNNYNIDYTDRSEIINKAFEQWIENFKSENTSEDQRIIDYQILGWGTTESNPNKIRANIQFIVTPFSKENTIWEYSEPEIVKWREYDTIWQKQNICFVEMTNVEGEYKVDYIGTTPEGYDKFLERFEEYKKNNSETTENVQIQGQETTNNLANQKIEKMSNTIYLSCSIILFVMICSIIIKITKTRKRK